MIGRVNTGGGTGATLTVTAPSGCTVTVTKDGKTKTKTAGADGVAVFKGLATGQWTVTITDGEQTSQKSVTITADYSTAITFFSATIHVTYPAGSTCTATDGVTTLIAPDTSGTWACVVPNAGTWIVSCTDNDYSASINVTISINGQTVSIAFQTYIFQSGIGDVVSMISAKSAAGSVSIKTDYIKLSFSTTDNGEACAYTRSKVDLTKYKTLYFDMSVDKIDSRHEYGRRFGVFDNNNNGVGSKNNVSCIFPTSKASRKTYPIDVSSINTKNYIGTRGIGGATIYNIWLE